MSTEKEIPKARSNTTSGLTALQFVDEHKKQQARILRRKGTPTEKLLWTKLRNRLLEGLKFRRQQVIEGFIVDFYCEETKLVIEVDGQVHENVEQQKLDNLRELVFKVRGLHTLRFKNESIENHIEDCLAVIKKVSRGRNSL